MRFPHIMIGQSFLFDGRRYTKTGIMTASEEGSGRNCMIRRSAEVTLLSESGLPMVPLKEDFKRRDVLMLLQVYRQRVKAGIQAALDSGQDALDVLEREAIDDDLMEQLIEQAGDDF
ncbi:MAG: hypothetical protein ABW076_17890 [Candidatus Thiodiazotropha sp.]